MSFIQMLETEEEAARKTWEYAHKTTSEGKNNYVLQRVHTRVWNYVKSIGVMPVHIQQTHKDLYGLYMNSRGRATCECQRPKAKPKPCKCKTTVLFQQGCQCGSC